MRRALTILLVALGGFLTAFIGGSAVAGAAQLPGAELVQNTLGTVENSTTQRSTAETSNDQSNVYAPVSILSPSSGDSRVEQGNAADNSAESATVNDTDQALDQAQDGTVTATDGRDREGRRGGDEGGTTADVDQSQSGRVDNETDQDSKATVDSRQSNVYAPISILSPSSGDSSVEQGNWADNSAESATVNDTRQGLDQGQDAMVSASDDSSTEGRRWMGFGSDDREGGVLAVLTQSQSGRVSNETDQDSAATVDNEQSNTFAPISFLSPSSGDNRVEQGNWADNSAESATVNDTRQGLDQGQDADVTATDDSRSASGWDRGDRWDHHDDDRWSDDCDGRRSDERRH